MRIATGAVLILSLLLVPWLARAHGLAAEARMEGDAIVGSAAYSTDEPAADVLVELFDGDRPDGPRLVATRTDSGGAFRFATPSGQRFVLVVHGEEDHQARIGLARDAAAPVRADATGPSPGPLGIAWGFWITGAIALATLVLAMAGSRRKAA